jgi:deazaflavin-dependent oxidoreductase (nitroreductase family)
VRPRSNDTLMPDSYGDQLAAWGKVVVLETTGRVSGRAARTAVGFVAEPDGSLLVAAGSPGAHWAANLRAHPACHGTIGAERRAYRAEEIDGPDRSRTISELILKYGTPAEALGAGPAFRLQPREPSANAPSDSVVG